MPKWEGGKCVLYWGQLSNVERALRQVTRAGLTRGTPAYDTLWRERGKLMAQLGRARPRITLNLGAVKARSPGEFRAWFDIEQGWMIEARETPYSDPIYHNVPFALAQKVLTDTLTETEEAFLLVAPEYVGE